jgi:hypothetical protein
MKKQCCTLLVGVRTSWLATSFCRHFEVFCCHCGVGSWVMSCVRIRRQHLLHIMTTCYSLLSWPCHAVPTSTWSRINCSHGVHRAPSAALALQGFLVEEKGCTTVVVKHCTLDGWDVGQANLIEEWLETEAHRRTSVRVLVRLGRLDLM